MPDATQEKTQTPHAPFARAIGRSRFVVLVAVVAVLLVSVTLFAVGTLMAGQAVWHALQALASGQVDGEAITVEFLEVVGMMLKAVIFYIVGVGLYSLFIAPLNLTAALGVESFNDLETRVVSVLIVIMALTFLEHFLAWKEPLATLQFGVALAAVIAALVLFQRLMHREKEAQRANAPDVQARAQREMFHGDHEQREVRHDEVDGTAGPEARGPVEPARTQRRGRGEEDR